MCLGIFGMAILAFTVFQVSIANLALLIILLACPLMHIFMMKGHSNHKEGSNKKQNGKSCH